MRRNSFTCSTYNIAKLRPMRPSSRPVWRRDRTILSRPGFLLSNSANLFSTSFDWHSLLFAESSKSNKQKNSPVNSGFMWYPASSIFTLAVFLISRLRLAISAFTIWRLTMPLIFLTRSRIPFTRSSVVSASIPCTSGAIRGPAGSLAPSLFLHTLTTLLTKLFSSRRGADLAWSGAFASVWICCLHDVRMSSAMVWLSGGLTSALSTQSMSFVRGWKM
mmetsp:Transcript_85854/g.262713  ORF Transcript_85854/g.262713 Transcript_85854/m.262713 type:complete len:219 (-) Transcript_85854:162-818(-)